MAWFVFSLSLPRWWWPDWSFSASKRLKATVYLHPPRHPPHTQRHTLLSVSGGAHVTCHVRSPGPLPPTLSPSLPSLPFFFCYRLCFFSGFLRSGFFFYFPCYSFSDSPSSLSLFIGRPSFLETFYFLFEFKPGSGLRHCGSLRFAESA